MGAYLSVVLGVLPCHFIIQLNSIFLRFEQTIGHNYDTDHGSNIAAVVLHNISRQLAAMSMDLWEQ